MVSFAEVQGLFQNFKDEVGREPLNVERAESLLSDLKVEITKKM